MIFVTDLDVKKINTIKEDEKVRNRNGKKEIKGNAKWKKVDNISILPPFNVGDLGIHKNEGNGNCMFTAISLSMYSTKESHSIICGRMVQHAVNNWNLYHEFIKGDNSYNVLISNKDH